MYQKYEFEANPHDVSLGEADEICISNTTFSLIFSLLMFTAAINIVIAFQYIDMATPTLPHSHAKEFKEVEAAKQKSETELMASIAPKGADTKKDN